MRLAVMSILSLLVLLGVARASPSEGSGQIELQLKLAPETGDLNSSYIILKPLESYELSPEGNISISITAYRGKTLKRTVYAWIEDASGKKVSSTSKASLPTRFTRYNITANLSLTGCLPSGKYVLVAEGIDTNTTADINLETGCAGRVDARVESDGDVSFSVIRAEEQVSSGKSFRTRLLITNPAVDNLDVDAWSYVYRSSKCYSGEREQNMKTINLPEYSNVTFELENTVDAPEGDYSLKIKFLRSDRKTAEEITLPIKVVGSDASSKPESADDSLSVKSADEQTGFSDQDSTSKSAEKRTLFSSNISGTDGPEATVYRSSSARAWSIAVYILIVVLTLVLIALILKKL